MQRYNPALLFTTAPHYRHIEATYVWFSQKGRRLFEIPATKWHHFLPSPLGKNVLFATNPIDYQCTTLYNDLHLPPGNGAA